MLPEGRTLHWFSAGFTGETVTLVVNAPMERGGQDVRAPVRQKGGADRRHTSWERPGRGGTQASSHRSNSNPPLTNTKYKLFRQAAYPALCFFYRTVLIKVSVWVWQVERHFFPSLVAITRFSGQSFAENSGLTERDAP